jgi:hypothetical protein
MNATEHSYKARVRELRAQKPGCAFFRELLDTSTFKCYGIQLLSEHEVQQALERFVGYYGRAQRTFTAPFDMQRGHKIVTVSASKHKPVRCWEHIYAQI